MQRRGHAAALLNSANGQCGVTTVTAGKASERARKKTKKRKQGAGFRGAGQERAARRAIHIVHAEWQEEEAGDVVEERHSLTHGERGDAASSDSAAAAIEDQA
ncbi:hypothetical protein MRX96_023189 [Rhipicephalus microplus]